MKKNNNMLLGVVLIVLIGLYFLVERDSSSSSFDSNFLNADSASITKISITKSGESSQLEKINNVWMVDAYEADKNLIGNALNSLSHIELSRFVTDKEDRQASFQVNDEKGIKVQFTSDGKEASFYIGKQGASYKSVFLRKDGENKIYSSKKNFKSNFNKSTFDWKNKAIVSIPKDEISSLEVKVNGKNSVVIQNQDSLNMVYGADTDKEPGAKTNYTASSMLNLFKRLNTAAFPKDVKADFTKADLSITINKKNAEKLQIDCVRKDDKNYYVKRSDKETIFQVAKSTLSNFEKSYSDLKE